MRSSGWLWVTLASTAATMAGVTACVDLFHSTEFETLCEPDAAACAPDGAEADGGAGPDGGSGITDVCAASPAEARERAERVCAWMGACFGASPDSGFGACVIRALSAYSCTFNPNLRPRGEAAALWSCLAEVASCDDASECLFGGPAPTCSPSPSGTFTGCGAHRPASPSVACGSSERPLAVRPCALEGRTCATVSSDTAVCAGAQGASCTGASRCQGTHAVECASGAIPADIGIDCAGLGAGRCALDDAGAACAPGDGGPPCDESSALACDADGAVRSCVDGKLVVIRCAELGFTCAARGASPLVPSAACENVELLDRCTGDRDSCTDDGALRSCAQGGPFELDCATVGLGLCAQPDAAAGSPSAATCTLP